MPDPKPRSPRRPRLLVEELEPRILYSADAAALLGHSGLPGMAQVRQIEPGALPGTVTDGARADAAQVQAQSQAQSSSQSQSGLEIVFIDSRVPDAMKLADQLMQQRANGRMFDIVMLNGDEDGIEQINRVLANEQGLAAIHIISHGANGVLEIGSTRLDAARLAIDAESVARWGQALSADGDLLLYGCDVAQDAAGQAFVQSLARLTGADVAASDDATGHVLLGGDWQLEFATGHLETVSIALPPVQQQWFGLLDTATLTATQDTSIKLKSPDDANNFGASSSLVVDRESADLQRALLQFDLSSIPVGSTINSATLRLTSTAIDGSLTINVYELTQAWTEGTGTGGAGVANWNLRQTGTSWTAPGGTFAASAVATLTTSASGQHNWNVATLVQAWVNGSKVNNGVMVASPDGGGNRTVTYSSREGATAPQLLIDYTPTIGVPSISGLAGDSLRYTAGGGPIVIEQGGNASVTDSDSPDFNTGTLTVSLAAGSDASEDLLAIRNQGTGAGQIGVAGANVSYGGTVIGSFAGGSGGTPLVVTLNANANPTSTAALIRNVTFQDTDTSTPTLGTRTVRFVLNDGDGKTSINVDTSVTLGSTSASAALWVSSSTNATSSGGSGGLSWTDGQVIKFGDPNLALGTGTTAGTFSSVFDIDNFASDGNANVSGLHQVSRSVVVGSGGGSFTLQAGDVLLAVDASETLGGVAVTKNDIVLFRPTSPGNYSAGTFSILLQNPTAKQLADFTLVEQTMVVGGTTLQAGEFLIGEAGKTDIYRFAPTATGAGTTAGTLTAQFIKGGDINIGKNFAGLELVQAPVTLGGVSLAAGQLLVALDGDDSTVGSNNLAVLRYDVFTLSLTSTGPGTTAGTAAKLFTGADVGMSAGGEEFDALALVGVNQAPVLSGANNLISIAEDPSSNPGTLVSALISGQVTDGDTGALTGIAVTAVDNNNGTWQWSANAGVNWTAFGSPNTAAARLLIADSQTYVRFVPNADWNGTVSNGITFRAWDQTTGTAGLTVNTTTNGNSTAFSSATASSSITVTAVNDAPSATNLSAAETYTEDTALNLTDIVISDVDSASVTATLTLSDVAAGSLNTATSGAVTSTYNAGTGVWSATGARANVNTLLAALTFTPASNFNSNFTIATSVSDGVAAAVTGSKAMTGTAVNDAPTATNLSAAETYTEDTALNLTDIVISDFDSASVTATLTLSNTAAGSLNTGTSGAVTSAYNAGTGVWTASGTIADVNALLAALTFTPAANFNSNFTIAASVSDGVAAPITGSKAMTGTAVNDAPTATNLSVAETYTEDTPLNLTDIVISDVDSASVTATLTLSNTAAGSLNTGTSGAVTSTYNAGTGVWTASGAIANVNALLAGLTYTPAANFNSNFTISTSVSDGVAAPVTGSKAMTGTAVNDAPVASNLSAGETYTEDTALNLTDIVISDVDSTNVTATLTLSDTAAGSLNTGTSGAVTSIYNAGTGLWTASGAVADVNALLAGLTFTPAANFNSNFTISTSVSDGVAAPVTGSKAMTGTAVNDAPIAMNLSAAETYTEDTPLNLTDIAISDVDSANVTATLTLSNTAAGSLNTGTSGAVTSTYNAGTGVWTASGAVADVNTLLAGLTFTPAANFNSNFTIATSVSDAIAAPVTGIKAMTGTAVNDAPTATNLSATETYTQDTPLNLTDIVISDVDSANVTATLTLSNTAAGSLNTGTSGAVTSTYNAGTGVWTASGALADVNTLLAGLAFTPTAGFNGAFTVATSISDGVAAPVTGSKAVSTGAGMGIWTNNTGSPQHGQWNGSAFGVTTAPNAIGEWTHIQAAEAPTRTEIIAVGVDANGVMRGEMWNGSTWTAFSFNTIVDLGTTGYQSFQVAYEQQSGDAMLVWDNGTTGSSSLSYRTWNGTSWSAAQTITTPVSGEAVQMRLAADPNSDSMILAVTGTPLANDYALVWNGSSWGNSVTLDTATGIDGTEIHVAYEAHSGQALVVYDADGTTNAVNYRTWDGTSWSAQQSLSAPAGVAAGSDASFTVLVSDPNSNRIALGVVAEPEIWLAVWDGSAWTSGLTATASAGSTTNLNVALAFEHDSGDLMAAYGKNGSNYVAYRTWTNGGGWSAETASNANLNLGATPGALTLAADPNSNQLMLGTRDSGNDVRYALWTGSAWGPALADSTGDAGGAYAMPMAFVWYDNNRTPVIVTTGLSMAENSTLAGSVASSDADGDARSYSIVGGADQAKFTIDSGTGALSFISAPDYESPTDAGANNVYDVIVQVADGKGGTDSDSVAVTVTNANDAPLATNLGAAETYTEDTALNLTDIVISDVDSANVTATLTLSNVAAGSLNTGTSGAVTSTYNAGTGLWTASGAIANVNTLLAGLTFTPAANFNSTFTIATSVSDGVAPAVTGSKVMTGTPVNDAPVITSNGGGANASIGVAENTTAVTIVTSSDIDGGAAAYSILAGGDAAKFAINSVTGALSFVAAADYENPTDVGANNVYDLTVQVSDGSGGTVTQIIAVTVANVADGIRVTPISVAPIASETRINTTTSDIQTINPNTAQAIATDAAGNFVVVWASNLQDGSSYGVYAQRFSADGAAQGTEFLVNTTTADNQLNPAVAMDAAGNFVVTWASNLQDGGGYGLYAQRYNAAGVAQGSEFLVNTTTAGSQSTPAIAMSSSGAFVIAWTSGGQDPDASSGIYAQRFNASGVAQGSEVRVNTYTINTQQLTSLGMDGAGNFVVIWASLNQDDGASYGIYGQRFDASGVAQGAEFRVNTTIANSQLYHDVSMLDDGRFVVAYQSRNADNSFEVYLQRYAADGSALGGETRANTTTVSSAQQPIPSITADASGNITVVWNSAADGSGVGVVARRFDWSGAALTGEFQVNTTTAGNQLYPEVVAQAGGRFIVAWGGSGAGDADGVFLQRYGLTTTEASGTATFNVVLEAAPTADVVISVSVPDSTEGTVSASSLTFTSANWNIAQTVTVTGLQDYSNDGDVRYTLVLGAAASADPNFNGLNPADLTLTNLEVVNLTPVNAVPGAQTVNEDAALVFSSANGNAITISDADAGTTNAMQVTLSMTNGLLTLGGVSGLSFSAGANGSATMTFTGTIASINTALNGLRFDPTADFNGSAVLTLTTNDQGNSGTGGARSDNDTVAITVSAVNDDPVLGIVTGNSTIPENNGPHLLAPSATVSDIDSVDFDGGQLVVSITANGLAEDRLTVRNEGTGAGQVGVSGANISYGGVLVGSFNGPVTGSTTLIVTFNANASAAVVQAVVNNLTYENTSDAPSATVRTIQGYVTDGDGGISATASGTVSVTPLNDAPVGAPTISGTATENQTLTANVSGITDADGLGAFSYQWTRNGVNIAGATGASLLLGDADVGANIRVVVSYTDAGGTAETLTSAAAGAVANVNDVPTGSVTIDDTTPTQGQTLAAANTLADADGLGAISYQWQRGGVNIAGATAATYTVTQADVGQLLRVVASYTDAQGTAESVASADTAAVVNVNDAPTGGVTVDDTTPTQGQTLTAANTLADVDGLGTISYQWQRGGVNIAGATGAAYTTTQADVGQLLRVVASYTDGQGTAESVASADTAAVVNVNDAPTGGVTIDDTTPTQGQTLTAANTLADVDGLGAISYQWQRGGVNIAGATSAAYTTTQADVGQLLRVVASYTDGQGTAESVASADTAAVANVNDAPTGSVTIDDTTPTQGQTLNAANTLADVDGLGAISYQWQRGGVNIAGATGASYTTTQADVGQLLRVVASYTDGQGTVESVTSADTAAVANVNDAPTGSVTIDDTTPTQGQTLTAANTLTDVDGLGAISYQWQRGGVNIAGATGAAYTTTQADVGQLLRVVASYTDAQGTAESVASADTAAVVHVNDAPTGSVTIDDATPTQGQTVNAANTLADVDGLGAISYQWQRGGVNIAGATGAAYTTTQADVGQLLRVVASYTDGQGTAESVASADTAAVVNVNDAPAGSVTIDDTTPTQGQTLTAANTLADVDGLGAISYQWQRGGVNIVGATGASYTTTQADVGQLLQVVANYIDGQGTAESVASAATAAVANVNDAPTGNVTIDDMTPTQGQTLNAANTLADVDGLGAISYQWQRGGVNIAGATGAAYTTTQADVGQLLRVVASYTDGQGTAESVASADTAAVANVNDAPTGSVTIDGTTPTQGQTLTAANTLADVDGLGAISYQWQRGGVNIAGATGAAYTTTQADVGQLLRVVASYTDAQGTAESVASADTAVVINVNDAPTGGVTINDMTPTQGQTLTAANTLADVDGLGAISYQWQRGGVNIAGATGAAYMVTQADVGELLRVVASYTDAQGTAESVASADTASVANVNDAPTGSVTIDDPTPTQGQTLNAANTLADVDGLGAISYQWQRGGVDIVGATGATYVTSQADVGSTLRVVASYTDVQGTAESVASADTAAVGNVNDAPTGSVTIDDTTPTQGQTLTAANTLADLDGLGPISYQWQRGGVNIAGATGAAYTTTQADVGQLLRVVASYTDAQGTAESVASADTAAVANVNDAPTGSVTIDDTTPTQGQTLTAANTLADVDGLGAISYQWQRGGVNIAGATGAAYTTTQADVGQLMRVVASYTDGQGTAESVVSADTAAVVNVNDAPTGGVTIDDTTPTQGQTLTAANTLADVDGLGAISYQWQRGGVNIAGATGSTYTTSQADVGQLLRVVASYTDGQGTAESVASADTAAVANVNDAPTGGVTIDDTTPTQGQTLTAANTLADVDGLGAISYQWQRGGVNIAGATGSTYTTSQADVGQLLRVVASYTDAQGTAESVASADTAAVANFNDAPTGGVMIDDTTPTQGQTLTAANTLADADGLGAISYQWQRGGVNIAGATGAGYTVTQADVGQLLRVVTSYTDGQGTAESVASADTAAVTNVNDAPTGSVTIDDTTPTQGQTLNAANTLADADGLGAISYQWQRGGVNIAGATGAAYTTTQADVGQLLRVVASYTDGQGTAESVVSADTAAVANVNDAPTGGVTIDDTTPTQGQTLNAANTLADADGLGTISYQWQRGGVNIAGANVASYTTTQADVGQLLRVVASYTDALGTAESVASADTSAVTNLNDVPTGGVTIDDTTPTQGQTLTASNTLADADGLGAISYQWQRGGVNIAGATGAAYTTTQADVGQLLRVVASYTDGQGTAESVVSADTAAVTNVNDAPTGNVTIDDITPTQGQTLTAANTLADVDGLGAISYQWQRGGVDIVGATSATYIASQADVGSVLRVVASYTDGQGTAELVASADTGIVANVNDAPTGSVSIDDTTPTQGQTLTASNTLADVDGLGTITYQWQRGGVDIVGAAGATYVTSQADVGSTLRVVASYTDGQGTPESVASANTAVVANVNDAPTGGVTIDDTTPTQGQTLTASNTLSDADGPGTISYQWQRGGVDIVGATGLTYVTSQADVGSVLRVVASYTDGQGTPESVASADTAAVANVNDAPTGGVTIDDTTPSQGQTLTAANTLADVDGLGAISYQWQRGGVNIAGAAGAAYTTTQADVGQLLRVVASYTDGQGTAESVASADTAAVVNVNDAPTGSVTIDDATPTQGQTLTAANTLADADGLGAISYQWQRGGVNIAGATAATYSVTQADVGQLLRVVASYTDAQGTVESVASADTAAVANVNDAPTGSVTIDDTTPTQGQTLTAANTLADIDGLGAISYQWQRGGVNIAGATGAAYTTTQADVGQLLRVVASYTDAQGTAEIVASAETAAVSNVNDAPTGGVTIDDITPTQGQMLNAANTLADVDGLGAISYQWQRGGVNIAGATGASYTTTQADVGQLLRVVASYTDAQGSVESVASADTAAVANVNDAPIGSVTIDDTAPTQGQALNAANTLADVDGLGAITYQWQRGGVNIAGATGAAYTTTQADVGQLLRVLASYTDGQGTAESVASADTAVVANVNDAPTGGVTIDDMTPTQGQTLTAANTLADVDGLGAISYQWQRGGVNVGGATGAMYVTTQADVGQLLRVVASYTDAQGTAETVASAETAAVANVNDAPTGNVAIDDTTPTQGQSLTAANTLVDVDGLGAISYQWQRGGVDIAGATGATHVVTQADVGQLLRVVASYTDALGTAESVASADTAAVANVNDAPTGGVTIDDTTPTQGQTLTATNTLADVDGLGAIGYQWQRGGVDIAGATGASYTTTQADVGQLLRVVASYTDAQGTVESVASADTAAVANVNDAPTGSVTIDDATPAQGQTLTAANTLADVDGLGPISYQWQRGGVDIAGATGATYTTTQADVGQLLRVLASYTDGQGTAESVASAETAAVANVNDAPTGGVTINDTTPTQGQTLNAANTLADVDGLGTISYQWQRGGLDIGGATGATYDTTQADVGQLLRVVASYTDAQGAAESVASADTAAVANVNDAPTGSVTIDDSTPTQGQTLNAANTLADVDGLGAISYQWQRGGVNIAGATGAAYTTTQADVGQLLSVVASYTDGQGTAESMASADTAAVANVNDAPTGSVAIDDTTPTQGQTLTASNTLADADGLGAISYQWQRGSVDIVGATGATYVTSQADVGSTLRVVATYTDGQGTAESVVSADTAAVTNVNDAPTGNVTIDDTTPTQGQTLTATNTLADVDGLGAIGYQWQRGGVDIAGATGASYTTTQADVGQLLRVVASYTDAQGTVESVASADTAAVANVNDAPTGSVTIDDATPAQGQTLTAANTLADADGLGTISYQWQRGGVDIVGATGSTYITSQADVGSVLRVVSSYTDALGAAESVASADTAAVTNVNDAPTGSVTIDDTTPTQGQTLTAANTLADVDGLGAISYQWQRGGVNIAGATGASYATTQADVGQLLRVVASYTDALGTVESVASSETAAVTNVNDAPTGNVTIDDTTPTQGQTLNAANTLADSDGLGAISYQWQRGGVNIAGATAATYTTTQADVGHLLRVVASYTDAQGTAESVTSSETAAVTNVNDAPTGSVTIDDTTPTQGQTLNAANTLADVDGLGAITYQWQRGGVNIAGATGATYTTTQGDVGQLLLVVASYTDAQGAAESVASADTAAVANVNDAPTGSVTIDDTTPTQGQTLTASNTLADADGLGAISYQWQRAGVNIAGATGATYTTTQADVGQVLRVEASYTDGQGTVESVASADTSAVSNVNDAPTGAPVITGAATEDQTLTADTSGIADADGLGAFSYQWTRDGVSIAGATGATFALGDADVGARIGVVVSYIDGQGALESLTSAAVGPVANANDAPVLTSLGGGATASVNVAENLNSVTTLTASDIDLPAQTLTYAIVGGADAARFTINASTGILSFVAAPDFETPLDANADNVYDLMVQVSDGTSTDTQRIAVVILDVNEAPRAADQFVTLDEGAAASLDLLAATSDADAGADGVVDPSSLVVVAGPSRGAVVVHADGTLAYTHDGSESTSDSFTYAMRDAAGLLSNVATVHVVVTPVNDAPQVNAATFVVPAGQSVVLGAAQLNASDADDPAASLVFAVTEVLHARFESVAAPGTAITQFSQGDVAAGQVRLVSTSATIAPTFRIAAFDGRSFSASVSATVVLNAAVARPENSSGVVVPDSGTTAPGAADSPIEAAVPGLAPEVNPAAALAPVAQGPAQAAELGGNGDAPAGALVQFEAATAAAARDAPAAAAASNLRSPVEIDAKFDLASLDQAIVTLEAQILAVQQQQRGSLRFESGSAETVQQVRSDGESPVQFSLAETARVTGLALTAGTVWWALRAGGLLSGLLVSLPAWRHADLLVVLPDEDDDDAWDPLDDDEAERDEQAVGQMLEPAWGADPR